MTYNKEYYKRYREEHKEQIAEKHRLWVLRNPEKERARAERQKESGYTSAYQKHYRTTAQSKFSALRSRAATRGIPFNIDRDTFIYWFNEQPKHCRYCKTPVSSNGGARKKWLTIDRMDNSESYYIRNITISCYRCNILKADDISFLAMIEIGGIIEKYNKALDGEKWIVKNTGLG